MAPSCVGRTVARRTAAGLSRPLRHGHQHCHGGSHDRVLSLRVTHSPTRNANSRETTLGARRDPGRLLATSSTNLSKALRSSPYCSLGFCHLGLCCLHMTLIARAPARALTGTKRGARGAPPPPPLQSRPPAPAHTHTHTHTSHPFLQADSRHGMFGRPNTPHKHTHRFGQTPRRRSLPQEAMAREREREREAALAVGEDTRAAPTQSSNAPNKNDDDRHAFNTSPHTGTASAEDVHIQC